ncbi:MAG: DNA-methyltransferase [Armatimonadota bacterium]
MEKIDLWQKTLDSQLPRITGETWDAIVVSSWFTQGDLSSPGVPEISAATCKLLSACSASLRDGGLLFVYGAPHRLPAYAEAIPDLEFRHWFGLQVNELEKRRTLPHAHMGILLFHKGPGLDIEPLRVSHRYCSACGKNLKDWGGKQNLLNPRGTILSDVWTDLPLRPIVGNRIPGDVLRRVEELLGPQARVLHLVENKQEAYSELTLIYEKYPPLPEFPLDVVEEADCIEYMESLLPEHEDRAFDLVFADPPYNLEKLYARYSDARAAEEYLTWCGKWLTLCARLLRPGGALYVLNLPKWALHHARTLDRLLDFRHWIVWQAMAEPRGKILPAHYAILYYTKPGAPVVFNYDGESRVDSLEYCRRPTCVKRRKAEGDDRTTALTDVWGDIHRIRHKRDRDDHPCQLPERLIERIIALSTNPGQVVFDPLCGAGTTAAIASRLGRRYVTLDLDPTYVEITRKRLAKIDEPSEPAPRKKRAPEPSPQMALDF